MLGLMLRKRRRLLRRVGNRFWVRQFVHSDPQMCHEDRLTNSGQFEDEGSNEESI